ARRRAGARTVRRARAPDRRSDSLDRLSRTPSRRLARLGPGVASLQPSGTSSSVNAMASVPHHHRGAFGDDAFGRFAEKAARFFGTPRYIVGQTILVALWILVNVLSFTKAIRFDGRPFILLNLIFSTQAAYAAPLILLAQTRQADRDKTMAEKVDKR